MQIRRFPEGFLWGAATAAYQIEGGVNEGGRGESIWDRFSHTPGKVLNGDTGDVACDHYHRWEEDLDILKAMGAQAYRFSFAWPRVFPLGDGDANPQGFEFYDRLVDGCLARGIRPVPTLYHWDLPQALQDIGGWPNPEVAERFGEYARAMYAHFGDRITEWITLNEPWVAAHMGYYSGDHAPGHTDLGEALRAGHTFLLAHGLAVQQFRDHFGDTHKIGLAVNLAPTPPATQNEEDVAAAQRFGAHLNQWFLDPVYKGEYPDEMRMMFAGVLPDFTEEQRALVTQPIDFVGINYYSRNVIQHNPTDPLLGAAHFRVEGAEHTAMEWEIYPKGLQEILEWVHNRYNGPVIYITENGAAFNDEVGPDGEVNDPQRIAYLQSHFQAALDAIANGVKLEGYFAWSLLDNFEWAFGYSKRFGIVYVDYQTLKRIPKASSKWYSGVIERNGVEF